MARICGVLIASAGAIALRRGLDVWIAIRPSPTESFYYNPVSGESSFELPSNGVLAPVGGAGLLTVSSHINRSVTLREMPLCSDDEKCDTKGEYPCRWEGADAHRYCCDENGDWEGPLPHDQEGCQPDDEKKEDKEEKKDEAEGNKTGNETSTPHPTLVPLEKRISCVPHCTWKCTNPVCEQQCTPHCAVPKCETRCPKLSPDSYKVCKVQCNEPNCAMYCPEDKDLCNGTKTLDCANPRCVTRCAEPKCRLDCPNNLGCKTECPEPACEWRCRRPKACPTPTCSMVCEQPPECAHSAEITAPGEKVNEKHAVRRTVKWVVGSWSVCSNSCGRGTKKRTVKCNSGVDEDCGSNKPSSTTSCESVAGCRWKTTEWEPCSSRCDEGVQTREVKCEGPQCNGSPPPSQQQCHGRDPNCNVCKVTVYGSKDLNENKQGWTLDFDQEGSYSGAELEYRGAKCDDISSLEVVGVYCEMTAYQYGDFNRAHSGWRAEFHEGKHEAAELEAAGAQNNDISSFELRMNRPVKKEPIHNRTRAKFTVPSFHPHSSAAAAGIAAWLLGGALLRL